jgi:regulatory protein
MSSTEERLKKAKSYIARYCAIGERSPWQISTKLEKIGLNPTEITRILDMLRAEDFLNERRFACAFANDKLQFNSWGKKKIKIELRRHQVETDLIEEALGQISKELYAEKISQVLKSKLKQLSSEDDLRIKKKKMIAYAMQKGFDFEPVQQETDRLLSA